MSVTSNQFAVSAFMGLARVTHIAYCVHPEGDF
jgi:hypothetical protein